MTVVVQVLVWVSAGIWTAAQLFRDNRQGIRLKLGLPGKLGLCMILFLALSAFESEAPLLTAYKVGQMFVCLLFTCVFVQKYGIETCIKYIFWGSTILCAAIAVCAFIAPDLVFFLDEGKMRLRGDPIAVMGIVGTYSTILLFIRKHQLPKILFWLLLILFCLLLAFSLTRQAWFLVSAFLLLYFAKRSSGILRKLGFCVVVTFPLIFMFYVLPELSTYRSLDSVWSLTGRTDLWIYLANLTLARAPWTGLGYYSASRIFALDFNPGMGTAHSILIEVLLGGGLLALIPCLLLCFILSKSAVHLIRGVRSDREFTVGALFIVTMILCLLGGDFGYGEIGITFWSLAAAIPLMVQSGQRLKARSFAMDSVARSKPLPHVASIRKDRNRVGGNLLEEK